jgi:hypothetical protein
LKTLEITMNDAPLITNCGHYAWGFLGSTYRTAAVRRSATGRTRSFS